MWHRLSDKESPEKEAAIARLLTNAVASGKDGDFVFDVLCRCDEADTTELVKLNVHSSIMRQLRRLTFEDIQNEDGWECCRDAAKEIPRDAPRPLGKAVKMTSFVDANLHHDLVNG